MFCHNIVYLCRVLECFLSACFGVHRNSLSACCGYFMYPQHFAIRNPCEVTGTLRHMCESISLCWINLAQAASKPAALCALLSVPSMPALPRLPAPASAALLLKTSYRLGTCRPLTGS